MTLLEIHEFSTGIQVQGTPDNWVSNGFTGAYMNATLDPIPTPVRNAIADLLFALAQGASTEESAVIGRQVVGEGGETWAVIAVIVRAKDDRSRGTPLYRYFLTRGGDNLGHLVAWMVQQQVQQGKLPVFDPFEKKTLGQPTLYDPTQTRSLTLTDKFRDFPGQEAPIIIPPDRSCSFPILHTIATEKAKRNNAPVSWAYNVKELEKPTRFQAIYPASPESQTLFENIKNAPPPPPPPLIQEEELRNSISGLVNNPTIDPQLLWIFLNSLAKADPRDPQHEPFWNHLLENLGEKDLSEHSYPALARFLVLRAIIFPDTLPDALRWMEGKKKQEDYPKTFEKFQEDLLQNLISLEKEPDYPAIAPRLKQGVSLLVAELRQDPKILDATVELLKSRRKLWGYYFDDLTTALDNQLSEIGTKISIQTSSEENALQQIPSASFFDFYNDRWKTIFKEILPYWQSSSNSNAADPKYLAIADCFHRVVKERSPRTTSGKPVKSSRTTSGKPVKSPRTTSGKPVKSPRTTSGNPVQSSRTTSGKPVKSPRTTSGYLVQPSRTTSGKPEIQALKQAALFNYIARGQSKLPEDIPDRLEELQAFQTTDSNCRQIPDKPFQFQFYRVTVERAKELSEQEKVFSAYIDTKFRSSTMLKLALALSLASLAVGIFLGMGFKSPLQEGWKSLVLGIRQTFNDIASGTCQVRKFVMVPCPPDQDLNFQITQKSLKYLRDNFFVETYQRINGESDKKQRKKFVQEAIERILENPIPDDNRPERLDFNKMTNPNDTWEQERWKTAIRKYQEKVVKVPVNGIIINRESTKNESNSTRTWEVLKCEVARDLNLKLPSPLPHACTDALDSDRRPKVNQSVNEGSNSQK